MACLSDLGCVTLISTCVVCDVLCLLNDDVIDDGVDGDVDPSFDFGFDYALDYGYFVGVNGHSQNCANEDDDHDCDFVKENDDQLDESR